MSEILTEPAHRKYPQKIDLKARTVLIVPGLLTPEPPSAPLRSVVAVAAAWVDHLRLGQIIHYLWHIRSCRIWTHHLWKISIITFAWTILYTTHCEKSCKVNILQFQNISDGRHFGGGPWDTGSKWGRCPWQRDKIKECQISFCSTISLLICSLFPCSLSESKNKVKWDLTPASPVIDHLLKKHNIMFQNRWIHVRKLHPSP